MKTPKLSDSEKKDLFKRFKNRSAEELMLLLVRLKADKKTGKAEVIQCLLDIKGSDIEGLRMLQKKYDMGEQWDELELVEELISAATPEPDDEAKRTKPGETLRKPKQRKKRDKYHVELSDEVAEAMVSRINLEAKIHRGKSLEPD